MKKIYLIICWMICMICINQNTNGQSKTNTANFIEISGGAAIPTGNFALSDYNNNSSGFAQTGSHIALSGAWYLTPNIGVGGMYALSSFSVNVNALANGYVNDFQSDSGGTSARNYNSTSILLGPYFAFPLGKLTIEARILGGITNTTSPDIITTVINQPDATDPISISKFVQTSGTGNAFGLNAGLGLRYLLLNHLMISLRGDYFYSKPDITFENIGRQNALGREISSYNQPIAGISGTLGVGYAF